MDNSLQSTTVTIYGQSYTIRGKVDSEFIKKVADYVDDKMQEVGANLSSASSVHRIAILASMNIAGDLFQALDDKRDVLKQVTEKSEQLISTIEDTLDT